MTDSQNEFSNLDDRERRRFAELKDEWSEFASPGFLGRQANKAKRKLNSATDKLARRLPWLKNTTQTFQELADKAQKQEIVRAALNKVGKGGGIVLKHLGQKTLSRTAIVKRLRGEELRVSDFDEICKQRSYHIEPAAESDMASRWGAGIQGLGTGALGGPHGVALNLAVSMLLFFRATQRVALHYGYDAAGTIREQEIASQVTLQSLHPGDSPAGGTGDLFYRLMQAGEISVLKRALKYRTYQEMAERGASQLFYVRLRALANKSAQKALDRAGKEGIENTMLRRLLRRVGKHLPKRMGSRIVPLVAGGISALLDTYYMHRVIKGANLFYQKRFLAEKDERVYQLANGDAREKMPAV